jgi:hypothetical protein
MVDSSPARLRHDPAADSPKSRQRSRITNGSALLPGVDGRSAWIRRCKDLIEIHEADLGGAENASAAELSIVRRAATITTECEILESKFATAGGATPDGIAQYLAAANCLRRLLESIGLQRRAKDISPTLSDVFRSAPP